MQFAVQMQDALMRVEWDEALLKTPWANEQRRPDGVLLFRGLRMSVGMCTGDARRVQPSVRTGRQEYYGPIMNHAARLAVAAHGGQVLIHEDTVAAWRSCEETRVWMGLNEGPFALATDRPGAVCFLKRSILTLKMPVPVAGTWRGPR